MPRLRPRLETVTAMRLSTWDMALDPQANRAMNDGWGACNTGARAKDLYARSTDGDAMPRVCELGGIGCDVDHRAVAIINLRAGAGFTQAALSVPD